MDHDELLADLHAIHEERQRELLDRWDRSLPFPDATFDRWERARRLGFAAGASIYESAFVFGAVEVGEHTWIGPNVLLDGSGGLVEIGRYCSISAGVHIYSHDTVKWALSGGAAAPGFGPVSIGDQTYIGSQSIIAAGVVIGSMCVVGANSFVNRSVEGRTVVVGSPARAVGHVDGEGDSVVVVMDQSPDK